jgi:diguanylate cyclase (GGDEF)-like protein/PAS domain S-box-containing protein
MAGPTSAATTATDTSTGDECVLLIEGSAHDAASILDELASEPQEQLHVEWVTHLSSGLDRLGAGGVGVVVLDLTLPDSHGLVTFDRLFHAAPQVPILILTDREAEGIAMQAVQGGAQDYLRKDQVDGSRLRRAVRAMMDRRVAAAMLLENAVANVTLDSIGEAVVRTDFWGKVMYLNRSAEKMTGWSREEALGRPGSEVLRIINRAGSAESSDRDASNQLSTQDETTAVASRMNAILIRRDGSECGIENKETLLHDEDGNLTGSVFAFHNESAARVTSRDMSHLAHHDFLTGLPNRMLFNDRLGQAISLAERQSKQLAVMFVDLDHFKKINDSLGHAVGDALLQSVAGRLLACVRRTDTVSRLGGDEFLILLSQLEHGDDAAISARKILRALATPHIIDGKSIDTNVCVGVSTYPCDGLDAENLISKADIAMYDAKEGGRNTFRFFQRHMHARLVERQSFEADLRCALGRNEFLLHYQPKYNLQTGQITGMEALLRWKHPKRGMVSPAEFVPIAEQCGLIIPIGRWVLLEACKQCRAWRDAGMGVVPVAVNVSTAEFADKDFLSGVRAVLIATGVEPLNLELELTESVLMHDAESAVIIMAALKAMGVQLAIDDFGTGYSSFTYLRRFPSDALKLDRSFVGEITSNPIDAMIVSAMINIGKSLKRRVVAEGIETLAQLRFLQLHGCGEGQGYFFSRPVVAEEAAKLLKAGVPESVFSSPQCSRVLVE